MTSSIRQRRFAFSKSTIAQAIKARVLENRKRAYFLSKHPDLVKAKIESLVLHMEYIALRSMRSWSEFDDAEFYCGSWMGEGREMIELAIVGAEKIPELVEMVKERKGKKGFHSRRK